MESFNDLFENFFNRGKGKKDAKNNTNNDINNIPEIRKIIDGLSNVNDITDMSDIMKNYTEKELGEPDIIEQFVENGLNFERKIWNLEHGSLISVELIPGDTLKPKTKLNKSLEEQLKDAIDKELYEEAAKLRDLINKNKTTEITGNKEVTNTRRKK